MYNTIYRLLSSSGAILFEGTIDINYALDSEIVELDAKEFKSGAKVADDKLYLINELVTNFPTSEDFFKCLVGDKCIKIILIQRRKDLNESKPEEPT
jgi:hypothetical protein